MQVPPFVRSRKRKPYRDKMANDAALDFTQHYRLLALAYKQELVEIEEVRELDLLNEVKWIILDCLNFIPFHARRSLLFYNMLIEHRYNRALDNYRLGLQLDEYAESRNEDI